MTNEKTAIFRMEDLGGFFRGGDTHPDRADVRKSKAILGFAIVATVKQQRTIMFGNCCVKKSVVNLLIFLSKWQKRP